MASLSLATLLRNAKATHFLTVDPVHVRYLTGIPAEGGLVLVSARGVTLFANTTFHPGLSEDVRAGVIVRDSDAFARTFSRVQSCAFEEGRMTVATRSKLKRMHPKIRLHPTSGLLEEVRRSKRDDELRHIRRAHRITRALLRGIPSALVSGVTEKVLARDLLLRALALGAEGLAFEPIVAFDSNTSEPHHVAENRKLRSGDLVQIDVGAKVNGYCADMSEVFFTEEPTPLQRDVVTTLRAIRTRVAGEARAGTTTHQLDRLARSALRKKGWEERFCHALGHGVGLEIHEGVTLSQKRPERPLIAGEVIAIEPGVYFPGEFGMRVEDMTYVQEQRGNPGS